MDWVKRHETEEEFSLSLSNIIPVLVSAEFLQIKSLVDFATKRASKHATEINLGVLSIQMIDKIAKFMEPVQVDAITDQQIREAMYRQLVLGKRNNNIHQSVISVFS